MLGRAWTIAKNKRKKDISHLGGADKASGYDLGNDTHEVFGFMDNTIDFGKSGGFADGGVFYSELELLHVVRHVVQVFKQFLLVCAERNLSTRNTAG